MRLGLSSDKSQEVHHARPQDDTKLQLNPITDRLHESALHSLQCGPDKKECFVLSNTLQ